MEKFDGVRMYWDGKHLFAKDSKTKITIPKDCAFPAIPFEGELWYNLQVISTNSFKVWT
jgi:hypothetical protein